MKELIERQAAVEAVYQALRKPSNSELFIRISNAIKELPPAQQEQPAEWVPSTKYKGFLTCSSCEDCYIENWSDREKKWKYCPACGRRMS